MKTRRLAAAVVLVGTGAVVACASSGGDPQRASPGAAPPSARGADSARIVDWSTGRVVGRAMYGMTADQAARATELSPLATPLEGWAITTGTGGPVTAPQAILGSTWSEGATPSKYDMLFFATNGTSASGITGGASATSSTTSNFFALYNLYTATPTLFVSEALANGVDRNGIALSYDGKSVYVLDNGGRLYCYQTGWSGTANPTGTGAVCSGWPAYYVNASCTTGLNGTTAGATGSSPWVDYGGSGDIYFGDTCGYVNHVQASNGTAFWPASLLATVSGVTAASFKSSPVVMNGTLFIGDDAGRVFKITGATTAAPTSGSISSFVTCGGTSPCANWVAGTSGSASTYAIRSALAYDTVHSNVYVATNDQLYELPATGTFTNTASSPKTLGSGASGPMVTEPTFDTANPFLYTTFNNKLFKVAYPFTSTSSIYTTALQNSGTSNDPSSPLPYNGYTYIGDSSGYMERFDCNAASGVAQLDGVTSSDTPWGNAITTDMTLDYATGNILFGYSAGTQPIPSGPGGIVQFPQTTTFGTSTSAYVCPSATPHLCTGTCTGGTGDECQQCCASADCAAPTGANAQVSCVSGSCVYACNPGYTSCAGNIQTLGCTNTQTDTSNCGACGTVCSSTHIPTVSCTAGVCSGECADGYVHCSGTRQATGCETSASCSACCPSVVCSVGTVCADPGYNVNSGVGECLAASQTQVCATAAQGSEATVACPTGQAIKSVVFADYGQPSGTCGQSFASSCEDEAPTGRTCAGSCTYSALSGTCIPTACSSLSSLATCNANTLCAWNATLGGCMGAYGYLHYYGTTSTYSPACAQDVSQSAVTAACVGQTSCSLPAKDDVFGTAHLDNPVMGQALPLSPACTATTNCAANPCPNLTKSLAVQVSCDVCGTSPALEKTVFVTGIYVGSILAGNFGALTNADAACMVDATNTGLSGTYKAWISNSSTPATSRLSHLTTGYYVLPDGTQVAAGWAGLTSGTLLHAIDELANGALTANNMWTDTTTTGTEYSSSYDCSEWSSTSGNGLAGNPSSTSSTWTAYGLGACSTTLAFYCIEQ